jgi:hypothetical protein
MGKSVLHDAFFASLSANSFPLVPAWAFTHLNCIFQLVHYLSYLFNQCAWMFTCCKSVMMCILCVYFNSLFLFMPSITVFSFLCPLIPEMPMFSEDKSVTELACPEGSQIVMDVQKDIVVCTRSSLMSPPILVLGRLPSAGSEQTMLWSSITSWPSCPSLDSLKCHYMYLTQTQDSEDSCSK